MKGAALVFISPVNYWYLPLRWLHLGIGVATSPHIMATSCRHVAGAVAEKKEKKLNVLIVIFHLLFSSAVPQLTSTLLDLLCSPREIMNTYADSKSAAFFLNVSETKAPCVPSYKATEKVHNNSKWPRTTLAPLEGCRGFKSLCLYAAPLVLCLRNLLLQDAQVTW